MTEALKAIEVNCETGETTERLLTAKEIADIDVRKKAYDEQKTKEDADAKKLADLKISAKAKLIAGTPLTAEEADTLVI